MACWIIWFGKTTIGKKIFRYWKKIDKATVLIDGDQIRDIFSNEKIAMILKEEKNAERIRNICILLDKNNINVIVSVLSIFPDMLLWNRKFKKYFEVFLNPKFETLISRDVKGLYKNAKNRKIKNIVGIEALNFIHQKNQI